MYSSPVSVISLFAEDEYDTTRDSGAIFNAIPRSVVTARDQTFVLCMGEAVRDGVVHHKALAGLCKP